MYPEWKASFPDVNVAHWLNKSYSANLPKIPFKEGDILLGHITVLIPQSKAGISHLASLITSRIRPHLFVKICD